MGVLLLLSSLFFFFFLLHGEGRHGRGQTKEGRGARACNAVRNERLREREREREKRGRNQQIKTGGKRHGLFGGEKEERKRATESWCVSIRAQRRDVLKRQKCDAYLAAATVEGRKTSDDRDCDGGTGRPKEKTEGPKDGRTLAVTNNL